MMYIRIAPHPATKVKITVMPHQTCDSSGDLSKGVEHKDIYNDTCIFKKRDPPYSYHRCKVYLPTFGLFSW